MSIKDNINSLQNEIEGFFTSNNHLHPNLVDLRNKTFHAHAIVESLLETSIFHRIMYLTHQDTKVTNDIFKIEKKFVEIMTPALSGMMFEKKLEFAQKIEAVDTDTFKSINKLNNLRNQLGHPLRKDLKRYESQMGYKEALETIQNSLALAYSNDGVEFGNVILDLFPEYSSKIFRTI